MNTKNVNQDTSDELGEQNALEKSASENANRRNAGHSGENGECMSIASGKARESGANDIAQAPPAQDNQEAEKMGAGGCLPRPCSAPVELVLEGVCANCQCRTEFKTRVTINSSSEGIDSRWFIR